MQMLTVAITVATILYSTMASATEITIKPGLWEISTSSPLLGLASQLPDEQMRGIQDLAKEYGFEVPEIKQGAAKSTTCVTPEMAKQQIVPSMFENDAGCSVKNIKRNGNHFQLDYTCKNTTMEGNGLVQVTLIDHEQFTGETVFNGNIQGNLINERANIQGKWLANTCNTKSP